MEGTRGCPTGPGRCYVQQTYTEDRVVEKQSQGHHKVVVALLLHL